MWPRTRHKSVPTMATVSYNTSGGSPTFWEAAASSIEYGRTQRRFRRPSFKRFKYHCLIFRQASSLFLLRPFYISFCRPVRNEWKEDASIRRDCFGFFFTKTEKKKTIEQKKKKRPNEWMINANWDAKDASIVGTKWVFFTFSFFVFSISQFSGDTKNSEK